MSGDITEQQSRSQALDSKAGGLLGFSGVLMGLAIGRAHSAWSLVGVVADGFAALAAGFVHLARGYPQLGNLPKLRERYLARPSQQTRMALLDIKVVVYEPRERVLRAKARLV